ncbi:MAG: DNA polymerase/3'-5' exonuclease PolX [Cytophagaceae bacterium]
MQNQEIINQLKLASMLMELHEENAFKIRGYQNAVFNLDKVTVELATLSLEELTGLEGIGKGIAAKIHDLCNKNEFAELNELLEKTPKGIIEMLDIKGIGPKKVRTIWKELKIEDKESLLTACNENKISALKGFGEKTQEAIKLALVFTEAHKEKFLYAEAEESALKLEKDIQALKISDLVSLSGEIRRKLEVVETVQVIIGHEDPTAVFKALEKIPYLIKDEKLSAPFAWRGQGEAGIKTEIKVCAKADFVNYLFIHSASSDHLKSEAKEGKSFFHILKSEKFSSEEELYKNLGLQHIEPEMREGLGELELAREHKIPALVQYKDLRGILHNHSTYSDGSHSLEEMALYCKELGFEYLGISDHSKTAFYANGLQEFRVKEQHKEIDQLNKKLAPFKIFKGIESDILNDGALDYEEEVLASFDFIVASIHSNLKMTEEKATTRLIKAIENPYTTILGHATGRLLLKREAYPIDHQKVIDACAANNVVIEINAHPRRLDMDWRWVRYAIEKGIMISINPDAHEKQGYWDMQYGVYMGRKAGLSKELTFNSLSLADIENHFTLKKKTSALKV